MTDTNKAHIPISQAAPFNELTPSQQLAQVHREWSQADFERGRLAGMDEAAGIVAQFERPRMDCDDYTFIREATQAILSAKDRPMLNQIVGSNDT
jgi:hypothetical protein